MKENYKLGSLFDGSGGFPLAGALCGIEPVWASEVEPYPIAVTRSRFPMMKHLGDISKINGGEIEPVDVITFGSPCQDLSVAGKRAGLKHEANGDDETTRSGLFMEAVRIIKEMRTATNGEYPRFALWENVPGAFSSNRGEDFRIVCEELIKIVEPSAFMPPVPKAGWSYADSYIGDGWSLAYRVFDAQYWGVPQRRRRIHLIFDFRGECAREILFEREGLRGYFTEGRTPWQTTPADAQGSTGADDPEGETGRGRQLDAVGFINAIVQSINCYDIGEARLRTPREYTELSPTITARCGTGGNNTPALVQPVFNEAYQHHGWRENEIAGTLTAAQNDHVRGDTPLVCSPVYCLQGNGIDRADTAGCNGKGVKEDVSYTLNTIDRPAVAFQSYQKITGPLMANSHPGSYTGQDALGDMLIAGVDCRNATEYTEKNGTLQAKSNGGFSYNCNQVVRTSRIVRRLTPTECARLQGFADNWGHIEPKDGFIDDEYLFWLDVRNTHAEINGRATKVYTEKQMLVWYNKLYTDGAEYKMWGNGIALPPALYCMQGITDAIVKTEEVTDLSDAPEEIKEEIMKYAELLENRENETETKTATVHDFNAAEHLKRLANERKALAALRPSDERFADDIRALEYAANVLEAIGL